MKRKLILSILLALATPHAFAIGRLASVDLFDRTEQRALPVYWYQGKAYVVGTPGNEYQITVRNIAGQDVLVVVSVDGVNVVSGETASPQQSGYVVDSWQQMDIAGWRKSLARTAAFYFTSLGDSYAARTGRPNHVGVIGAALYRRKADPVSYAPDYPAPWSSGSGARDRADAAAPSASPRMQEKSLADRPSENPSGRLEDKLGTGHGRSETSPARYTRFERATPQPEEIIRIYYDSYANLVALGVIPAYSRREPQPFPGRFVADPPR
ncbi:MAG: hypothetical protein ABI790_17240 [Betaproteobacteria bacterium]